jgi:DNA polymerase III subunit delta'
MTLQGNIQAKGYLEALISSGNIPHLLLFHGPKGVGKTLWAMKFSRLLLGNDSKVSCEDLKSWSHPDLLHFHVKGKAGVHTIESMRLLQEEVAFPAYEAKYRVIIIHEAHQMLVAGANALLKTLEEPRSNTVIVMLTHKKDAILPTILSRCQEVRFTPLDDKDVTGILKDLKGITEEEASKIAALSQGSIDKAIALLEGSDELTTHIQELVNNYQRIPYFQLVDWSKKLDQLIEKRSSELEKNTRLQITGLEDLGALQKQDIEKEIQGMCTVQQLEWLEECFSAILSLFRQHIIDNVSIDQSIDLEEAFEAVQKSRIGIQKSLKPSVCLEYLCLRLNWLAS